MSLRAPGRSEPASDAAKAPGKRIDWLGDDARTSEVTVGAGARANKTTPRSNCERTLFIIQLKVAPENLMPLYLFNHLHCAPFLAQVFTSEAATKGTDKARKSIGVWIYDLSLLAFDPALRRCLTRDQQMRNAARIANEVRPCEILC